MTALIQDKLRKTQRWAYAKLILATGSRCFKGSAMAWNGAGKIVRASSIPGLVPCGVATEEADATSADKLVVVELPAPVKLEYFVNAETSAVAATDLGKHCFFLDDQTVTMSGNGRSKAGRVWDISGNLVGVELVGDNAEEDLAEAVTGLSFTSNNLAVTVQHGAVYDIPTTGAASTVTLAAPTRDGIEATFLADGTKNGHTVQYRDATGTVLLTAALTASKRHLVRVVSLGGVWAASSSVAP